MWTATYTDGKQLNQSENLFKEIDQSLLDKFSVDTDNHKVMLNIKTGEFIVNGLNLTFGYADAVKRLIYFRRVKQTMGLEPQTTECIGWQATVQSRSGTQNIKRILVLNKDNITILCD